MSDQDFSGYSRKQKWRVQNPKKVILSLAKQRAKAFGVPITITDKDFEIPDVCPVLGIELRHNRSGGGKGSTTRNSPTLDRINPDLGYIPGNVIIISKLANQIKSNANHEQIEKVCKWLRTIVKSIDKYAHAGSLKA